MYKLYNVRRWGSMAPHFLLEELDVPYTNVWMTPEQVREPSFRDISPLGYVPVLGLSDGRSGVRIVGDHDVPPAGVSRQGDGAAARAASSNGVCHAWIAFMSSNLYPAISLSFHPRALGG